MLEHFSSLSIRPALRRFQVFRLLCFQRARLRFSVADGQLSGSKATSLGPFYNLDNLLRTIMISYAHCRQRSLQTRCKLSNLRRKRNRRAELSDGPSVDVREPGAVTNGSTDPPAAGL